MLGPKGQVKSIQMAAYPGLSPTKSGWKAIQEANPAEAKRSGLIEGDDNDPVKMLREGLIFFRHTKEEQSGKEGNFLGREKNWGGGGGGAARRASPTDTMNASRKFDP